MQLRLSHLAIASIALFGGCSADQFDNSVSSIKGDDASTVLYPTDQAIPDANLFLTMTAQLYPGYPKPDGCEGFNSWKEKVRSEVAKRYLAYAVNVSQGTDGRFQLTGPAMAIRSKFGRPITGDWSAVTEDARSGALSLKRVLPDAEISVPGNVRVYHLPIQRYEVQSCRLFPTSSLVFVKADPATGALRSWFLAFRRSGNNELYAFNRIGRPASQGQSTIISEIRAYTIAPERESGFEVPGRVGHEKMGFQGAISVTDPSKLSALAPLAEAARVAALGSGQMSASNYAELLNLIDSL